MVCIDYGGSVAALGHVLKSRGPIRLGKDCGLLSRKAAYRRVEQQLTSSFVDFMC